MSREVREIADIELEIHYLKGEIKSMHSIGMLVPSRLYERLHILEKVFKKMQRGGDSNESNTCD